MSKQSDAELQAELWAAAGEVLDSMDHAFHTSAWEILEALFDSVLGEDTTRMVKLLTKLDGVQQRGSLLQLGADWTKNWTRLD